jgi:glutamyl-tRNA synthetase
VDDLDRERSKDLFTEAAIEDLKWLGINWQEGPDVGGSRAPYAQSARLSVYAEAFETLRSLGWIYPCSCSRREVARALSAPHGVDDEPVYPGTCRPPERRVFEIPRAGINWRFRIERAEALCFKDQCAGPQSAVAMHQFGDFLVWRKDDLPAYQLASAVDDIQMEITEVVRGSDLITSTFRQILIWRTLGFSLPSFYHCALVRDENGRRLAKRDGARSLRSLREAGLSPVDALNFIHSETR